MLLNAVPFPGLTVKHVEWPSTCSLVKFDSSLEHDTVLFLAVYRLLEPI
jgi:hypothetical protein